MADDDTAAETYAKSVTGPYGIYYKNLMRKLIGNGRPDLLKLGLGMPDGAVTHEFVMDSLVITGTVNNVVAKIVGLRGTVDEFGTRVYARHDWTDPALARRSMTDGNESDAGGQWRFGGEVVASLRYLSCLRRL